jgi:hypothetical protein
VITFANITVSKTLEAKLRGQNAGLEKHAAEQVTKLQRRKPRVKP